MYEIAKKAFFKNTQVALFSRFPEEQEPICFSHFGDEYVVLEPRHKKMNVSQSNATAADVFPPEAKEVQASAIRPKH